MSLDHHTLRRTAIICMCHFKGEQKVLQKVRIFAWLLNRQKLVMFVFWKRMFMKLRPSVLCVQGVKKIVPSYSWSAHRQGDMGQPEYLTGGCHISGGQLGISQERCRLAGQSKEGSLQYYGSVSGWHGA